MSMAIVLALIGPHRPSEATVLGLTAIAAFRELGRVKAAAGCNRREREIVKYWK